MKKWVPTIIAVISALAPLINEAARLFESKHPEITAVILSIYAIFAHQMPSPTANQERR